MPLNIMIVDDSPLIRRAVRRSLQMSQIEFDSVREAENGRVALDLIAQSPADLVITDLHMPVLDGEGLVRALAESGRMEDMPVIVVSSDRNQHRLGRLLLLGVWACLPKPVRPEVLGRTVRAVLDARPEVEVAS